MRPVRVAQDASPKQTRQCSGTLSASMRQTTPAFWHCSTNRVCAPKRILSARIFGEPFKVIKIDKAAVEYYTRLTALYSQYRGIAVNYNQVVKALNTNFSEKKALAFLSKLEKATIELADLNRQIIELTREFETRWLQK